MSEREVTGLSFSRTAASRILGYSRGQCATNISITITTSSSSSSSAAAAAVAAAAAAQLDAVTAQRANGFHVDDALTSFPGNVANHGAARRLSDKMSTAADCRAYFARRYCAFNAVSHSLTVFGFFQSQLLSNRLSVTVEIFLFHFV